MIKSMTAYGRGEAEGPGLKWVVELRTVNHRFLELSLNLPKRLWALEDRFRKLIKSRISRGRVDMQLSWEYLGERTTILKLDRGAAVETGLMLIELQMATGLTGREIWFGENYFPPTSAELCVTTNNNGQNADSESANF